MGTNHTEFVGFLMLERRRVCKTCTSRKISLYFQNVGLDKNENELSEVLLTSLAPPTCQCQGASECSMVWYDFSPFISLSPSAAVASSGGAAVLAFQVRCRPRRPGEASHRRPCPLPASLCSRRGCSGAGSAGAKSAQFRYRERGIRLRKISRLDTSR